MLKDVKKRIVDHLKPTCPNIAETDARLWHYTHDKHNVESQLTTRAAKVQPGFKDPPTDLGSDFEANSGVEFPG